MPFLRLYCDLLNLLGWAATIPLLMYAEELLTIEQFTPAFHLTNTLCLALPCLADAVESAATVGGLVRCTARWLVTGDWLLTEPE